MKQIGLIIPVRNLNWMTINLLESIKITGNLARYYFIIVENGSDLENYDAVNKWLIENNIKFYHPKFDEPLGFVKAVNIGIVQVQKMELDYFFILNNDIIVTSGWDLKILETLKRKKIGLVGPMTSPPSWREMPQAQDFIKNKVKYWQMKDSLENFAKTLDENFHNKEKNIDFIAFYCVGMKTEVIEKVGILDERFNMGLFDDDDYCYRVKENKFEIVLRKDAYVHHYHNSSFLEFYGRKKYMEMLEENRKVFINKWGFDPWERLEQ